VEAYHSIGGTSADSVVKAKVGMHLTMVASSDCPTTKVMMRELLEGMSGRGLKTRGVCARTTSAGDVPFAKMATAL